MKEESRLGGPLHNPSILPAPSFSSLPMSSNGKKTLAGYRPKSRKKQTILPNGQPKSAPLVVTPGLLSGEVDLMEMLSYVVDVA